MSLVAYDDSDESGIESDEGESPLPVAHKKRAPANVSEERPITKRGPVKRSDSIKTPVKTTGDPHSASTAPKPISLPSSHTTSINFDMKILDKNRSQPIRITIPSLKDFEEEEPKKPKIKPSTKGSSLFSMLPAPKNVTSSSSKTLMPQSVSKAHKPKPTPPVKRPSKPSAVARKKQNGDEEEEGSAEPLTSFFFSGGDDEPLPPPIDIDIEPPVLGATSPQPSAGSSNQDNQVSSSTYEKMTSNKYSESPLASDSQTHSIEEDSAPLDADALKKLCGSRDRKKGPDLSEIIDVSGSSLVGDSSMILAKELSKEQPTHSFKRKSECSSLQRRKHQITYLAEQAKAQELELRNNWAQNRVTRKQTQAKYGF